ncbi:MAG TPA: LytTR family DNA-binding domain-containing protein [Hanamia sp.]|nr:LytTR family DNA-binding domain-containing protein [Hanamia sp.]
MINVIIIEDEIPAMKVMLRALSEATNEVTVQAKLKTVKESIEYLKNVSLLPDIIFSDVQLPDGLSFDIFKQTGIQTPVIFTTAYDQFMLLAFENNGIDYILKPVEKNDIEKALGKYRHLKDHFTHNDTGQHIENLINFINHKTKSRLLVKKGLENILLRLEDIILFYTENKMVFVIDRFSKKYIADKTLSQLESEMDENTFFRANRRYIVNLNFVKGFKPYEKVKLLIDLNIPEINHSIIVSQETAPAFRQWMRDA